VEELLREASAAQLRALCRWLWGWLQQYMGRYLDEPGWERAAREVVAAVGRVPLQHVDWRRYDASGGRGGSTAG